MPVSTTLKSSEATADRDQVTGSEGEGNSGARPQRRVSFLYARLPAGGKCRVAAQWSRTSMAIRFSILRRASRLSPPGIAIPTWLPLSRSRRRELIHMSCTDFYYEGMVELAEKLAVDRSRHGKKKGLFREFWNRSRRSCDEACPVPYEARKIYIVFWLLSRAHDGLAFADRKQIGSAERLRLARYPACFTPIFRIPIVVREASAQNTPPTMHWRTLRTNSFGASSTLGTSRESLSSRSREKAATFRRRRMILLVAAAPLPSARHFANRR